jgi:sigma-B regulation protein RsbU (phosphoserine phosphatase)
MAEADKGMSAGEVIRLVNRHITRMHKLTQFVTVLYGILNLETREFNYARAGHEPPLVLTADARVERLPHNKGIPLGLMENIVIDQRSVVLSPGTTLLMYTDGMLDCRNAKGEPFGLERIKQTLSGLVNLNAQRVCDVLFETLKNYQDGAKQDDDVALVAVHVAKEESPAK